MSLNKTAPYDRLFKHFGIAESVEWFRYTTLLNVEVGDHGEDGGLFHLCVTSAVLCDLCGKQVPRTFTAEGAEGRRGYAEKFWKQDTPRFS